MFVYKKIILMVILAMSVVGCELLSPKEWSEDKYGNRH